MAAARSTTAAAVDDVTSSVAGASSSTLDRLSAWYADNKVAAWTIAGVTVVAVGGSIYYLNARPQDSAAAVKKEKKASQEKKREKVAEKGGEKDGLRAAEEGTASSGKAGG